MRVSVRLGAQIERWADGMLAVAETRLQGELETRVLALVDEKALALRRWANA